MSGSVAAATLPEEDLARFERLERSTDPDVQWRLRENLKSAPLTRLHAF